MELKVSVPFYFVKIMLFYVVKLCQIDIELWTKSDESVLK